jgi:hypothetical protein
MLIEAIAGVDEVWPYPVFGSIGAGGGAVGGYFVEQTGESEPALYMLAGGMALVIPTLVAVLNATAYDPTEDEEEEFADEAPPPAEGPEQEAIPGSVEGSVEVGPGARRPIPPAFIGVGSYGVALGVPAVGLMPRYSPDEQAQYGVDQSHELRVPIVHGSF